jgi:hypothetical protein
LTYEAYEETLQEQQKKDQKLADIEKQVNALTEFYNKMSELKSQHKTPEEELKHANLMLACKKIEDVMVKSGMLEEKDRSANAAKGKTAEQITHDIATFEKEQLPAILKRRLGITSLDELENIKVKE